VIEPTLLSVFPTKKTNKKPKPLPKIMKSIKKLKLRTKAETKADEGRTKAGLIFGFSFFNRKL